MASGSDTADAGVAPDAPTAVRPGGRTSRERRREGTTTLVVMGVSGVGKTTVADELVRRTGSTFVEGDDLHPAVNRRRMASGHPLDDEDRWPWLYRIADWIGEQEAAGRDAVVTCSALKRSYRDLLREGHPSVRFVHLIGDPGVLAARLAARQGHFMPASLLRSQLDTLQPLQPDEPGVAVATDPDLRVVVDHVLDRLQRSPDPSGDVTR